MGQTLGRQPPVCARIGLFGSVWWERLVVFLLLPVYKSPPGVFLCAMEWGDSCSTALDKCDFLFLTHSKDAALVCTATDSDQLQKIIIIIRMCVSV